MVKQLNYTAKSGQTSGACVWGEPYVSLDEEGYLLLLNFQKNRIQRFTMKRFGFAMMYSGGKGRGAWFPVSCLPVIKKEEFYGTARI